MIVQDAAQRQAWLSDLSTSRCDFTFGNADTWLNLAACRGHMTSNTRQAPARGKRQAGVAALQCRLHRALLMASLAAAVAIGVLP